MVPRINSNFGESICDRCGEVTPQEDLIETENDFLCPDCVIILELDDTDLDIGPAK